MRKNKYIGNSYAELTVIAGGKSFVKPNGRREFKQLCRCSCGKELYVRTSALTGGNTKSCGCVSTVNYTGEKIGRLIVTGVTGNKASNGTREYITDCDCGTKGFIILHESLTKGLKRETVPSCGCYGKQQLSEMSVKHGLSKVNGKKTKLFMTWDGMKQRCYNRNHISYVDYGGRGIDIYAEWMSDFKNFHDWAYDNGFVEGEKLSIDRIDNDKGYYPDNCRWVTSKEQQRNRRTTTYLYFNGERKPLTQWAEELGLSPSTIRSRLRRGLSIEEALSTTMDYRSKKNSC